MIRFLDGPASGVVLQLRRAPLYLRVVADSSGTGGEWDALDQLDDAALPGETLVAYRRVGEAGVAIVCTRGGKRGSCCRRLVTAEYTACPDQPDDATMRDNDLWRAWATEQQKRSKTP